MTDHRKAVAHYAAQEDAARDYADARRYRFLREAVVTTDGEFFIGVDSAKHTNHWALSGEEADAAIDMELERAGRAT